MSLQGLTAAIVPFAAGVGTLSRSVDLESYLLLAVGMVFCVASVFCGLAFRPRPVAVVEAAAQATEPAPSVVQAGI